jgi:PAS domain S-box-containing protein
LITIEERENEPSDVSFGCALLTIIDEILSMTNILIVEDESIVAWDIKETLEKLGYQVVDFAISGAEAIRAATTSRPDLVLMDIRLAGAIDGITAGAEIYDRLNIPVVYLTAHADDRTLERATQTNPFGYILKPFRSQTLQSTIKVALQRHQLEQSTHLSQADFANTLNSIGNGTIVTDRQGLVTFLNPIAQKLTGWDSKAAIGLQIDRVFHPIWETDGTPIENPSLRTMRLKQPIVSPDRCWLVAKDGVEIPISDTATPICKPDGEVVGSIIVFQNNTDRLSCQLDLQERNQDLELFQLKLISQLQAKTAEYQQAISCIQVLDLVFKKIHTAHTETELLQSALEQLGSAIDADYGWCTLHDVRESTATIVCEYINQEHQFYPISRIGHQIDALLYPRFYNHLFERESWIDPPGEITPKLYLDLLTPAAQMLICPLIADPPGIEDLSEQIEDWAIGEVGIITTGKPWTACQARLIGQILSSAIKLFRQTHRHLVDRESIAVSLKWLDSLQAEFRSSIVDVNQAMQVSAELLHEQIRSIDLQTANLESLAGHQKLHRQLAVNLQLLQAEWQRQFVLIDTLIDVRTHGTTNQIQALSDVQFGQWIADITKTCSALTRRYHQEMGARISDRLPPKLLYPFPMLELIVLELFENACKYTPQQHLIILEVDVGDRQLQFGVVSMGIELSARELDLIFCPFGRDTQEFAPTSGITGLGLSLIHQLVPLLGGDIHANGDRHQTSLILTVPSSRPSGLRPSN